MSDERWIPLPVVNIQFWPPAPDAMEGWTEHYRRRLGREGDADALRDAVRWEQRDQHPYIQDFHQEAVEAAIEKVAVPRRPGRPRWTRETFEAAYREAKERAGAGATLKEIALEFGREPTTLAGLLRRFRRPR